MIMNIIIAITHTPPAKLSPSSPPLLLSPILSIEHINMITPKINTSNTIVPPHPCLPVPKVSI